MVTLKKVEIYGFKSFADKLEIVFDNDVTAIVGPNGCGKSNVSDAIRWVLGERSISALRGSSQQDFIFKGAETRKRMSYCEVSLFFDNQTRFFPLDIDEVVITRKMVRTGETSSESEYSINRTPCKQREIVDKLQDTGLGNSGYCVISQGQIGRLLSVKPEERRGIFEEAAGIAGYKRQKQSAERDLERAHADLMRISDQQSDRESRIEPLRRQAEKTRKYNECRDRLKYLEVNSYLFQSTNANEIKGKIGEKLKGLYEQTKLREQESASTNDDYNASMKELREIDDVIGKLQSQHTDLLVSAEQAKGMGKQLSERLSFLKIEQKRLTDTIEQGQKDYLDKNEAIHARTLEMQELSAYLDENRATVREFEASLASLDAEISAYQEEIELSRAKIVTQIDELGDIKQNIGRYKAEYQNFLDKIEVNNVAIEQLKQDTEDARREYNQYKSEIEKLDKEKETLTAENERLTALIEKLDVDIHTADDKARDGKARLASLQSRLNAIEEMRKTYYGYKDSIKSLMNDADKDPELSTRIEGVFANIIDVPDKYQFAIAQVLGGSLQNLVVGSADDAEYIFKYLRQKRYGNVTCLPLTTVKPYYLDPQYRSVLNRNGCYGIASDLVKYEKMYEPAVRNLLGRTVVVENMEIAKSIARDYNYNIKLVTINGEIINTTGSMSGGSGKEQDTRFLSQDREIHTLEESIERQKSDIEKYEKNFKSMKDGLTTANGELKTVEERLHAVDIEIVRRNQQIEALENELKESEEEIARRTAENVTNQTAVETIDQKLKFVDEQGDSIAEKRGAINKLLEERGQEFDAKIKHRNELQEKYTDLKVVYSGKESEYLLAKNDIERLEAEKTALSELIVDSKAKLAATEANVTRTQQEADTAELTEEEKQKIDAIKDEIAKQVERKRVLQKKVADLDSMRESIQEEIRRVLEQKQKEETNLQRIDTNMEILQANIWNSYRLQYAGALALKDDNFDYEKSGPEMKRLSKEVREFGEINAGAIEEYRELKENYERGLKQKQDAEKAENDLINIIKNLTQQMAEQFSAQFEQINQNFSAVFTELFGGGEGRLELDTTETDDPLEAGIKIMAEPPGKKLQNISLLSGGESALTAICIMFAIMKLKPLPFCLLDEIDSALDESNTRLLASYLRIYSKTTQFIVITHKKPMMELVDSMYGVTMPEKGISRMVSVRLVDALKQYAKD